MHIVVTLDDTNNVTSSESDLLVMILCKVSFPVSYDASNAVVTMSAPSYGRFPMLDRFRP